MGKGDKKSKRGKIFMGSYGASRRKRKNKNAIIEPVKTKKEPKVKNVVQPEVNAEKEETKTAKNKTSKKETDKKTEPKKSTSKKKTDKKEE